MNDQSKWNYIAKLDKELLEGTAFVSEFTSFLVKNADIAFVNGANLAALITSMAAIETHLKSEYGHPKLKRLVELINVAPLADDLRRDLHKLRKYRNKWVHVDDPWNDIPLLEDPKPHKDELEEMAKLAIKSLRRVIYWIQHL